MAAAETRTLNVPIREESTASAVSWAAIFAGAAVALALGLILLALGAGIGLASVSPWGGSVSLTTFTVYSAIWLIVVQWLSSALGGYVTGRLRTKWVGVHTDEVFFRDTAHAASSNCLNASLFDRFEHSARLLAARRQLSMHRRVMAGEPQGRGGSAFLRLASRVADRKTGDDMGL